MKLTPRQIEILRKMQDENKELVYERGEAWVGLERTSRKMVTSLLRLMALHMDSFSQVGGLERYSINETGRRLLAESEKR